MVEIERSFSKQNGVRVVADLEYQERGIQDMILGNQNFEKFQQVSYFVASLHNN